MNRSTEHIDEVLCRIGLLWKRIPDWRLGQVIYNLSQMDTRKRDLFYLEDEDFLKLIEELNNES